MIQDFTLLSNFKGLNKQISQSYGYCIGYYGSQSNVYKLMHWSKHRTRIRDIVSEWKAFLYIFLSHSASNFFLPHRGKLWSWQWAWCSTVLHSYFTFDIGRVFSFPLQCLQTNMASVLWKTFAKSSWYLAWKIMICGKFWKLPNVAFLSIDIWFDKTGSDKISSW